MTRPAKIALLITAALTACVIAVCGVALALRDWVPGLAGCPDATRPTKTAVFTEPARIQQMYPQLQPIRAVHWQEHETRARTCPQVGTTEYEMNGFVQITEDRAAALAVGASPASPPDVPEDLRPYGPADPHWLAIGPDLLLDRASATVYFTHFSSPRSSSPASPSSPGPPSWPAPPSSPPPS